MDVEAVANDTTPNGKVTAKRSPRPHWQGYLDSDSHESRL